MGSDHVKQFRANFACPLGGQALVAIYDAGAQRMSVETLAHQEPTHATVSWLASLPENGGYPDLDWAVLGLQAHGVPASSIEWEGI
jgi:hypothetical protein